MKQALTLKGRFTFTIGAVVVGLLVLVANSLPMPKSQAAPSPAGALQPAGTGPRINEIRISQAGDELDEYFELAGPGEMSLDGLTYLVLGDGTGGSGVIEAVVDLTGGIIPTDSFFVVAEATFNLGDPPELISLLNMENGDNVTHFLVRGFSGTSGDDLDTNDDGVLDVTPWAEELDRVALVVEENPPSETEYHYGPPTVGPDGAFVPGHVFRCPGGWKIGQFDPLEGQDTPGSANICLQISKAGPLYTWAGEPITYTLIVTNHIGSALEDVVITDAVPLSTTFAYALDGGILAGDTVNWTIPGGISDQSVVTRTFVVTTPGTGGFEIVNRSYGLAASNWPTVEMGEPVTTALLMPGCGDDATAIHSLQGSSASSPLIDSVVLIEGIVVGDYQGSPEGLGGFFVQEEDCDADGDHLTSEGIFIREREAVTDVVRADLVRVVGQVQEQYGLTVLSHLETAAVCSSGHSVTPVDVSLPVSALDDWESVEGMLVTISQELYVSDNYDLGQYGEVTLSAGNRLYQPTGLVSPGATALELQALNDLHRILLDDGNGAQNPDPIVYPAPALSTANTLRSGDKLSGVTGVVDYAYGAYRLQPADAVAFIEANARPVAPKPADGVFTVASLNVLNYFNGDGQGGGFPTSRGATTPEEFERQRAKIIAAIVEIKADALGLVEMENDGYGPYSAIQDLVNGLNAAAPAGTTYELVDPGVPMIGGHEITVGLIYRVETAAPIGAAAVLDSNFDAEFDDSLNRPTLAQTFESRATGERFTVAVNHLKSKSSSCQDVGDPDLEDGQGDCNQTRTSAAGVLAAWLATDPTGSGDPDFLIIGDLNAYAMEEPIVALENAGYIDLIEDFVGEHAYTYVFMGQAGYLDHALANPPMRTQVQDTTIWHINADEPRVLDYNMEDKSPSQIDSLFSPDPFRASDHDPVIVSLSLATKLYLPVISGGSWTSPVAGGEDGARRLQISYPPEAQPW